MNDELIIDTGSNVVRENRTEPLAVFDERHPMLSAVMPECDVSSLPNSRMNELVSRLKMTMKLYSGVGLSANQCAVQERVFVIGTDQFQMVCINPKIIKKSAEETKRKEGCLSSPGLFVTIPRSNSIDVEYYTEQGELKQLTLDGVTAQCFQHELDHLNGVTFTSKAGPVALQLAKKKQQKLINKVKKLYK
jgi:peptide deformylase